MRLFLGTSVPPTLSASIAEFARPILAQGSWRPAAPAQWHVTTLFIGEWAADAVVDLMTTVGFALGRASSFTLAAGRLCTMPPTSPTMLWIRFDPHPDHRALHACLAAAAGLPADARDPFWPHITVARARGRLHGREPGMVVVPWFAVDHLTLYRSDPTPQGSIHTALRTWPLRRTDPADPAAGA